MGVVGWSRLGQFQLKQTSKHRISRPGNVPEVVMHTDYNINARLFKFLYSLRQV